MHGFFFSRCLIYLVYFVHFQEAARLQRECSVSKHWSKTSLLPSQAPSSIHPASSIADNSYSSSRESSLGPASLNAVGGSAPAIGLPEPELLAVKSPRHIVIERNFQASHDGNVNSSSNGFGFTLRHFIVYPPEVKL